MSSALHLLVRFVHLAGMAVLLGGAVFAWGTLRAGDRDPRPTLRRYEWAFWGAVGAMIATGVGNLAAAGPPGPSTRWGTVLTGKLTVVTALVVLSGVRSLAVHRVLSRGDRRERPDPLAYRRLRLLYAGTGWSLALLVALAEVLVYG